MTAPTDFVVRKWIVDLPTAQRFLKLFKQPQRGVEGTNRKWSPGVVNRYAVDMLAGRWRFSHEGFAFHGFIDDGTAVGLDGEQRCRALIQACTVGATALDQTVYPPNPDFAFEVMVTEGLDSEAVLTMNIGKTRTAADFMTMKGKINGLHLTSAIQLCRSYEREPIGEPFVADRWVRATMTPLMRNQYLDENPGLPEAMSQGARLHRIMIKASVAAGYYLAQKAGVKQEKLDEFMDAMATGTGANWSPEHPALRLREMLLNAKDHRRILPREQQLALFIKAFNAFNQGSPIKRSLAFRTKGSISLRAGKEVAVRAETFPRFQVD